MEPMHIAILVPVALLVLWIALAYLWNNQWRPRRLKQRVPTATFNNILGRLLKFIFREDKYPIEKLAAKNNFLAKVVVWRNLYIFAALGVGGFIALGNVKASLWLAGLLFITIATRARKVFYSRYKVTKRMFDVAASEFKYPKDADLNPWNWVQVRQWESLTIPGTTVVMFPPAYKSEDPKNRENFERHFNGTVTDDNTWIYKWKPSQSFVQCEPMSHIPTMAPYPGSKDRKWDELPLGVGAEGEIVWNLSQIPHALVCGATGSGKSVLQRNIIFHCIQHKDMFRFLGVDVKRVELKPYAKYDDVVMGIGTNLEDGVEICRYARDEMMRRYEEMEELGVNHFLDLPNPPFALMLMIDEAYMFLAPEGVKTDEGKERDQLHGEATTILGEIARLGRAAGVHMVMATQRPDAAVIKGELKANLDFRIAAGRMATTPSLMTLDSDAATRLPGDIKGRGIVSIRGEEEMFQGYFAQQDWIDKWLVSNDPGNNDADGDGIQDDGAQGKQVPEEDRPKKDKGLLGRIKKYNQEKAAEAGLDEGPSGSAPKVVTSQGGSFAIAEDDDVELVPSSERSEHEEMRDLFNAFEEDDFALAGATEPETNDGFASLSSDLFEPEIPVNSPSTLSKTEEPEEFEFVDPFTEDAPAQAPETKPAPSRPVPSPVSTKPSLPARPAAPSRPTVPSRPTQAPQAPAPARSTAPKPPTPRPSAPKPPAPPAGMPKRPAPPAPPKPPSR